MPRPSHPVHRRSGRRAGVLPLLLAAACTADPGADPTGDGIPPWDGPGVSGYVESSEEVRIHVVTAGPEEAPDPAAGRATLLFVPGWTMTAEIWEPQLRHFAREYRVAAMDPRFQGRSSKPRDGHTARDRAADIRAVVEAHALEPVVLVGWSMGVTEVVAYVDAYGTDGVAGLVLVDGVAGQDLDGPTALGFMRWVSGFVHDRRAATEGFVAGMYRTPQSEAYLASVVEQALRTPTDAAATLIAATPDHDFRPTLPSIDRPTLVAATTGSPWDPVYAEMAAAIPGARLEWFEGAGHALFVDEADRFNALLDAFLRELPPAGSDGGG